MKTYLDLRIIEASQPKGSYFEEKRKENVEIVVLINPDSKHYYLVKAGISEEHIIRVFCKYNYLYGKEAYGRQDEDQKYRTFLVDEKDILNLARFFVRYGRTHLKVSMQKSFCLKYSKTGVGEDQ